MTVVAYRLSLGVGSREYLREFQRLSAEAGPADVSVVPLPVKALMDFASGRRSYASYRKAVRVLLDKVSVLASSERVYVGPVAVRYGDSSFLSILEAGSGVEVSRKFIRYGEAFKGFVPKLPAVSVRGLSMCFLVLDDLFYPEVARYCASSGSGTLIAMFPPVEPLDPELVVLAARLRAYENEVNVVVVGGYTRELSVPSLVVRKDGTIADMASGSEPEVLSIELVDLPRRAQAENLRRHYAKAVKLLNVMPARS